MSRPILLLSLGLLLAATSCVAPGKSTAERKRYVDPYTCEIENPREGEAPYDADCIRAAQTAAQAAAKQAKKK